MKKTPAPDLWLYQPPHHNGLTLAIALQDKKLIALEADHSAQPTRPHALFAAKVLRHHAQTRSLELDLGDGQTAFLNIGKATPPATGSLLMVEWLCPAVGQKLAEVKKSAKKLPDSATIGPIENGPTALERLQQLYTDSPCKGTLAPAEAESIDLGAQLTALEQRLVPLPRGGSLCIDQTEACHVLDVNGPLPPTELNRFAVLEAAKQIRLRNLGGIILIDLVGNARQIPLEIVQTFINATADDPCKVEVHGLTRLGLLEVTRQKIGTPLAELLRLPTLGQ
jgi:hypothetical protein